MKFRARNQAWVTRYDPGNSEATNVYLPVYLTCLQISGWLSREHLMTELTKLLPVGWLPGL